MSQTNKYDGIHKITIKNKNPNSISTSANTQVLIDDKEINGLTFLKIEIKPKSLVKVVMEMYAKIEVDANVNFDSSIPLQSKIKIGENTYVISKYQTVGIVEEAKDENLHKV